VAFQVRVRLVVVVVHLVDLLAHLAEVVDMVRAKFHQRTYSTCSLVVMHLEVAEVHSVS